MSLYRDEYSFPSGASGMVPILHGPGLKTQATVSKRRRHLCTPVVVFIQLFSCQVCTYRLEKKNILWHIYAIRCCSRNLSKNIEYCA